MSLKPNINLIVVWGSLSLVSYYMYYKWSTLKFTHFTFSGNFLSFFCNTEFIMCCFIIIYGHFGIYTSHVESLLLTGFLTGVKNVECDSFETKIFRVVLKDKKKNVFTVYF